MKHLITWEDFSVLFLYPFSGCAACVSKPSVRIVQRAGGKAVHLRARCLRILVDSWLGSGWNDWKGKVVSFVFGGVRLWGPYHKPEWFEGRFIFCLRAIINHTFIAVMIYRLPLGTSHPKQIDCLYKMGTHETFPFSLKAKWLGGRMLHPTDGNGKWLKWKFLATLRTCVIVGKHPLHVVKQWKQKK